MSWFLLNLHQAEIASDNKARLHKVDVNQSQQKIEITFLTPQCKTQDLSGPFLVFQANDCNNAIRKAQQICPTIQIKPCNYCCP